LKEDEMSVNQLPAKIARADTDGINNALEALVVDAGGAKNLAELLRADPIAVIRRTLHLNPYQRAGLAEMTKEEIAKLIAPVYEVLSEKDPTRLRGLRLVEQVIRQSPVKIKCHIEIEW
jgi:hypothetical protein